MIFKHQCACRLILFCYDCSDKTPGGGLHTSVSRGSASGGGWADPLVCLQGGETPSPRDTWDTVNQRVVRILLECFLVCRVRLLTKTERIKVRRHSPGQLPRISELMSSSGYNLTHIKFPEIQQLIENYFYFIS